MPRFFLAVGKIFIFFYSGYTRTFTLAYCTPLAMHRTNQKMQYPECLSLTSSHFFYS